MKKVLPPNAILIPDSAQRVFSGVIFDVYQWPQPEFDGSDKIYEMTRRPDTVVCICAVDDKLLVLDEEQPHNKRYLTFPTGKVDKSDPSTLVAAQREVKEETGYEFSFWRLVNVIQPAPKVEWFIYTYIATGANQVSDPRPEPGEKLKLMFKPFEEVKSLSLQGQGYIRESHDLFRTVNNLHALLDLPGFQGPEVDR